ncbi:MAG: rhomboid family intramembrane serine protease [Chloroflexi bacterium]|nr:rhomboid family intramembrane serine protease [Chloroflexota bacterium]
MCLAILFLVYFFSVLFLSTFFFPMPINDAGIVRYRTIPWMTLALILVNTVVFAAWLAPDLYTPTSEETMMEPTDSYINKINTYGFSETNLRDPASVGALTTLTSMFMHADLWHLFGNMLFLWAFGRRVEDACGAWRYLLFYLVAGMVANVGSVIANPALNELPGIGASGAIAGVMGAYLLLFPGAQLVTLWGLGTILRVPIALFRKLMGQDAKLWKSTVSLPAWLLLIEFAVENTIPSLETIVQGTDTGGVNYLAHLTGFLAALTIFLFVRKDLLLRYVSGRSL